MCPLRHEEFWINLENSPVKLLFERYNSCNVHIFWKKVGISPLSVFILVDNLLKRVHYLPKFMWNRNINQVTIEVKAMKIGGGDRVSEIYLLIWIECLVIKRWGQAISVTSKLPAEPQPSTRTTKTRYYNTSNKKTKPKDLNLSDRKRQKPAETSPGHK